MLRITYDDMSSVCSLRLKLVNVHLCVYDYEPDIEDDVLDIVFSSRTKVCWTRILV